MTYGELKTQFCETILASDPSIAKTLTEEGVKSVKTFCGSLIRLMAQQYRDNPQIKDVDGSLIATKLVENIVFEIDELYQNTHSDDFVTISAQLVFDKYGDPISWLDNTEHWIWDFALDFEENLQKDIEG